MVLPDQPQSPYPYADPGAAPQPRTTNGLSIAGFILAFFVAPIGFILSIIGLVTAGRRGQKGKGLAIAGIIISLLAMVAGVALVVTVFKNAATILDPGCTEGKAVILSEDATNLSSDPETLKKQLGTTVDKLNAAAAKANSDDVRKSLTALASDYDSLVKALENKEAPPADLQTRVTQHGNDLDALCTIGGAQQ
ncbi:hypothetical protein Pmi06nite_15240 [Planotetraspora mira]|jgi:hypothetical protein|uniref:DUF4190 domain-containing protein n=2 Tax=Planotetraspora mira TaxID=58121 RepID=A0A8J3TLP7_9ACTN|nr:hypothetical protein Pmi06nite_15240 [Planotetraspora mira]